MTTHAELLLQEYAQLHQLETQGFDNDKVACIQFEQDVEVHCQLNEQEDLISFYTYVSPMEKDVSKEALLLMLQANHFCSLTRGYTLSVSPSSNQVMLHNVMPVPGLITETFSWFIEQLASTTREWRNFLQTPAEETSPAAREEMFNLLRSV
ncbi:type III secretion system chaperone [Thalassomonas viridans]|uniref:Type III secretion system chaperone n=1 Tax=Thalassomonas viridans TaxID=137584 RepID=A0AAE9Z751_9GAMM|nr:type III secretion system chaperone [Thalassomonas viridans]WDE07991.1 type III secretion system chaperone [Thalassomonas viridans]